MSRPNVSPVVREYLFPTTVWFRDLPRAERINRGLLRAIERLRGRDDGIERSNFLGWHSPTDLHRRPEFAPICRQVSAMGRAVLASLDSAKRLETKIAECWANVNGKLAHNHRHHHAGHDLSAVYYVSVHRDSGNLQFFDPRPGNSLFTPGFGRDDVGFCKTVEYGAERGRLIMFPSWFEHAVGANHSGEERVSLAFNLRVVPRAPRVRHVG